MRIQRILVLIPMLLALCAVASAEMIRGLDVLPEITKEEAKAFPASAGSVYLHTDGVQLPYDEVSNTYFIPQSNQTESFDGAVELKTVDGWSYFLMRGADGDK